MLHLSTGVPVRFKESTGVPRHFRPVDINDEAEELTVEEIHADDAEELTFE